jgi:hypothetical protein
VRIANLPQGEQGWVRVPVHGRARENKDHMGEGELS